MSNFAGQNVTFVSPVAGGNNVTVLRISNVIQDVGGLMLQNRYTNLATGLILQNKIEFLDDGLPAEKVTGLSNYITNGMTLVVGSSEPDPADERIAWLDTSGTESKIKFYDGQNYVIPTNNDSIPTFGDSNALQLLQVNPTGTGLQWGNIDLSAFIQSNTKGAANGVASLNSSGRIPINQLPAQLVTDCYELDVSGAVVDGNYKIRNIFQNKVTLLGASFYCTAGTATVQMTINTVAQGSTYALSTATRSNNTFGTPIELDATNSIQEIGVEVTSAAALENLNVVVSYIVENN